jgi:hypothetical protein
VRRLWAVADPALNAYLGCTGTVGAPWPHLHQVCRVERCRTLLRRGRVVKVEREVTYAITSAPPAQLRARELLHHLRGHWGSENRSHYVRDVTWDEDRCQVRTGAAPQAFAACRHLALALLRRRGHPNIAAALRTYAAWPAAAVQLVVAGGRL